MKRRDFLGCVASMTVLSRHQWAYAAIASSKQPNFIFMLSDDQNWNGLSVQMDPNVPDSKSRYVQTPNLERLAQQGMRFSQAYAPSPVCSPTRASLQTGKSPAQLHWTRAGPSVKPEDGFKLIPPVSERNLDTAQTTVAELLKTAGYMTAHYGKWHLRGGGPDAHGYDESDGATGNLDAAPFKHPNPVDIFGMGKRAAAFIDKAKDARKPFFIQLSYNALHFPENASPQTKQKYREMMPGKSGRQIAQAALAENLDDGIGQLLQHLEQTGLAENTFVIFMSDNGGGEDREGQPLRGGKGTVYEGGIRVPMIVRGPNVPANAVCDVPVVGYDLFPTFCHLAGVSRSLPERIEGGRIDHLFEGKNESVQRADEALMFHFPHYQVIAPHSAIRLGRYKLIRFYEDQKLELYDLQSDLGEQTDLASQLPDVSENLRNKLEAYLKVVDAQVPTSNPQYDPARKPVIKQRRRKKRRG